ncbi:MAG TPA: HNH endonuclease [Gaiellales bacterium]|nr:HNH endonuclease [Gaiellales bacterium]
MTRRRPHSLRYTVYLHSPLWRARRWLWILQAGGRCEDCGRRRYPLTIHHLSYKRLGRERRGDVVVLCWRCHQARHRHKSTRAGRRPLALGGLLGKSRRTLQTVCALLLLASVVLVVHLAPTLLTLIPRHR